jgi:predicted MFS family arabinose efflux permease
MAARSGFWIPASTSNDGLRLLATRGLRGFADGAVSVLLPSYLSALGFTPVQIGAIVFGTLIGSAALTLWIGLVRIARRYLLLAASVLMIATGVGFSCVSSFWPLFLVAVVGTLNPSAGDVSLFLPIEQAALAETVAVQDLTAIFSRYNVAGAFAGALGALASGLPLIIAAHTGWDRLAAQRSGFLAYSAIALAAAAIYWRLTPAIEAPNPSSAPASAASGTSRSIVIHLAALFCLDAFGGGFVIQSLLALWLFRRFELSVAAAGTFFFVTGILGALSQFASSWLATRFGRINTMAYTHIPASFFLIAAALMPDLRLTLFFLILRAALSSMDVPARQSYVMAVVPPEERAAAAGITNVPRSLASALAPLPAGAMLDRSLFGWPLIACGLLKIVYDILLLAQFRKIRPPDEALR